MTRKYLVDGEIAPAREATVSVRDRGFLYGDAAFETMRSYGGTIFAWEQHLDRLDNTCDILSLDHGVSRDQLHRWVQQTLAANDLDEAAVRLSITRGMQPGVLTPKPTVDPTVVIIVRPLSRGGIEGEPTWSDPATVGIVDTMKVPSEAVPARAKTHNYLNGILARLELASDEDEAIMCDSEGTLTEGTTSNIFVVDEGTLLTPPLSGPVLPGITRQTVLELADDLGIQTVETSLRPTELYRADGAFLSNTTAEVWPIGTVDGDPIGIGPVTERIQTAFNELIEAEHYA